MCVYSIEAQVQYSNSMCIQYRSSMCIEAQVQYSRSPPQDQLSRKPRHYYQLPSCALQCQPVQCPQSQLPGNFPAGGRWCQERGERGGEGGLSIRWQLAWLPHHIWGCACQPDLTSYYHISYPTTAVKFDTAGDETTSLSWRPWPLHSWSVVGHFGPLASTTRKKETK